MGFIGSMVGGILGAGAAGTASGQLAQGAQQAQQLELKNQQAAQGSQATATAANQAAEQPYQQLGSTSAAGLQALLQKGFQAPTLQQAQQTPGYQFQLNSGTQALNAGGAATGNLISGTQGTALQKYGQGLGQSAYQSTYNNALQQYMSNYQSLMGGTQTGLNSTGQMGQFGQAGAQNLANIDLTGGQQQAMQLNNAALARAQGTTGQAASWGQFAGGLGSMAGGIMGGIGNLDSTGASSGGEQFQNFLQGM